MRNALTAFISAASFCVIATAASAQTTPDNTGAPLYSYRHASPRPAAVGSCEIVAGNRVCSAGPMEGYSTGAGGPVGMLVGAPFAIVAAPFGAFGGRTYAAQESIGTPVAPYGGATYAPATGAAIYSYESQVGSRYGAVGHCDLVAGNRVCMSTP